MEASNIHARTFRFGFGARSSSSSHGGGKALYTYAQEDASRVRCIGLLVLNGNHDLATALWGLGG